MNRKIKKLELNRETVRGLEDRSLEAVDGGVSEAGTCPGQNTCNLQCQTLLTKRCSVCCQ